MLNVRLEPSRSPFGFLLGPFGFLLGPLGFFWVLLGESTRPSVHARGLDGFRHITWGVWNWLPGGEGVLICLARTAPF